MSMRSLLRTRLSGLLVMTCLGLSFLCVPVRAEDTVITVPNGDFETPVVNNMQLGGVFPPLFGGTLTSAAGIGPWTGRSTGVFGVIVAPAVDIDPGTSSTNGLCRFSGLTVVNVLGPLIGNSASVSQTLSTTLEPDSVYTLEADVDRSSLLSAAVLSQYGVGMALTVGGTQVATSIGGSAPLLNVQLLAGTTYRLRLYYLTGETPPSGNIGIRLFVGEGTGILALGALPDVTFDNVKLTLSRLES